MGDVNIILFPETTTKIYDDYNKSVLIFTFNISLIVNLTEYLHCRVVSHTNVLEKKYQHIFSTHIVTKML